MAALGKTLEKVDDAKLDPAVVAQFGVKLAQFLLVRQRSLEEKKRDFLVAAVLSQGRDWITAVEKLALLAVD
jgi:hypothetical protein